MSHQFFSESALLLRDCVSTVTVVVIMRISPPLASRLIHVVLIVLSVSSRLPFSLLTSPDPWGDYVRRPALTRGESPVYKEGATNRALAAPPRSLTASLFPSPVIGTLGYTPQHTRVTEDTPELHCPVWHSAIFSVKLVRR
jgi:hypothetical protein